MKTLLFYFTFFSIGSVCTLIIIKSWEKLRNVQMTRRSESCRKGNCQVCDFICDKDTFTTKAYGPMEKHLKFKVGYLTVTLRSRFSFKLQSMWWSSLKQTQFTATFNNYKSLHRSYRKKHKVSQQCFHERYGQHSHNGIDDWQFTLI